VTKFLLENSPNQLLALNIQAHDRLGIGLTFTI